MALSTSRHVSRSLCLSPSFFNFSHRALATGGPAGGQNRSANGNGTAVVFMNMGGPSTLDEVHMFLQRLFSDGDLMSLGPFQDTLARFIAWRRTPKIVKQYSEIGGGSPIRRWTELQAKETCNILDRIHASTKPHRPYIAFRYAAPLTEDAFLQLKRDGIQRAVAFTQYPQYSCSTTGSSLNELWRLAEKYDREGSIKWSVIDRWPTHYGLVNVFANNIRAKLGEYPKERRRDVVLLFSAHSLPMEVVNRGDPYPAEVAATVHAVMEKLGNTNPYRLVWQSQVGPRPWLGAQTSRAIKGYIEKGQTDIVLIPIAFTSDHIETLFEIDKEIIGEANQGGIKRAESLNGNQDFFKALADIVKRHLDTRRLASIQLGLRCPECKNPRCEPSKKFWSTGKHAE